MLRTPIATWRLRSRRARIADVSLLAVIVLVFLAVGVNASSTVRDTKRSRLDKIVLTEYLTNHPEIGAFGGPILKVQDKVDLACAIRKHSHSGFCMQIDSRTFKTRAVLRTWNCVESPKTLPEPLPGPGAYYCPLRHAPAV